MLIQVLNKPQAYNACRPNHNYGDQDMLQAQKIKYHDFDLLGLVRDLELVYLKIILHGVEIPTFHNTSPD